jgi:hypothetical protein
MKGEKMLAVTSNFLEYRQKQRPSVQVATTLYDIIEAVSEQMPSGEEYLLTPTVQKLLKSCRPGFFCNESE